VRRIKTEESPFEENWLRNSPPPVPSSQHPEQSLNSIIQATNLPTQWETTDIKTFYSTISPLEFVLNCFFFAISVSDAEYYENNYP
jgi:hypothetical protein